MSAKKDVRIGDILRRTDSDGRGEITANEAKLTRGQAPRKPPPLAPGLHIVATPIGNLRRHHLPRARRAAGRRPDRLRGHARVRQAGQPLRHFGPHRGLQRRHAGPRRTADRARPGRGQAGGAGVRRRHAPDLRSRLPPRPGGPRRRPCRDLGARPLGGADGAGAVGPADRPLLFRRLSAGPRRRPPPRDRRRCRDAGDPGVLRGAAPAAGIAGRSRRSFG